MFQSNSPCLYQVFDPSELQMEAEYFKTRFDLRHQVWICPCNEWLESEGEGISEGGSCRHTQHLQQATQKAGA